MRRFWLAAGVSFVLATVAWVAGLEAQIGIPTPTSRWVFEAYEKKARVAAATPSPRILIVADAAGRFYAPADAWIHADDGFDIGLGDVGRRERDPHAALLIRSSSPNGTDASTPTILSDALPSP